MKKVFVLVLGLILLTSCNNKKQLLIGKVWNVDNIVVENEIVEKKGQELYMLFNENGLVSMNNKNETNVKWVLEKDTLSLIFSFYTNKWIIKSITKDQLRLYMTDSTGSKRMDMYLSCK